MLSPYISELQDANITDYKKVALIENSFRNKLEQILGGIGEVVNARRRYIEVFKKYPYLPSLDGYVLTAEELDCVRRWESAEDLAKAHALAGCGEETRHAYFNIMLP